MQVPIAFLDLLIVGVALGWLVVSARRLRFALSRMGFPTALRILSGRTVVWSAVHHWIRVHGSTLT